MRLKITSEAGPLKAFVGALKALKNKLLLVQRATELRHQIFVYAVVSSHREQIYIRPSWAHAWENLPSLGYLLRLIDAYIVLVEINLFFFYFR